MSNEPLVLPEMQPYSITIPMAPEGAWTHTVRLTWDPALLIDRFEVAAWPFWMKNEVSPLVTMTLLHGEIDPRANIVDVLDFIDRFLADRAGCAPLGVRTFNPVRPPTADEAFLREVEKKFDGLKGVLHTYAEKDV